MASLYGVDRDVVALTLVTLTRYYLESFLPQRVMSSVKKTLRLASLYGVDRDKQKTGIPVKGIPVFLIPTNYLAAL
ncbi:hypothetical protein [Peribacillus butanolivorans]|uniref:hypothetical protein n=1 Tax=Peribacillus butanolivorans TaxID=421767 RepID=UPI0036731CB1